MNVLFISNDPTIFDPVSATRARMRAYAGAIGTLHILSPGHGPATQQEEVDGGGTLFLHAVAPMKSSKVFRMLKRAKQLVRNEHIELVSAQDPFEYGWVAMRAVQGTSTKLHVQVHTDAFSPWFTRGNMTYVSRLHMPFINRVRQSIADRVLPNADGIRVVSQRIANSLVARYGDRIVTPIVIPIAVSEHSAQKVPLPLHTFTFVLMTVSRLEPEKRIEDILHALAQVHGRYPSIGLVIVGEGSERRKLERLASKLGLADNVMFLGNRLDAIGLMQSAHVYIQASGYEGYSRTLLEAALAGIPIITTDVGIVGEVFRGYEEVLSIPPGDPSGIATHIMGLIEDMQARSAYTINAEKAAREHLASVHTGPRDIAADLENTLTRKTPAR
jgi:glycosyltransferase involved in cell wall biosynthesis